MNPRRRAFTLIEVLVVIAVVMVLVALLLPVLNQGRASARSVRCRANLRTMQQGWAVYMSHSNGKIPHTRKETVHPNVWDGLDSVFPEAPLLFSAPEGSFNACPSIENRYTTASYMTDRWGYAVNCWWLNGSGSRQAQYNIWKSWVAIQRPSDYPWFMDPEVGRPPWAPESGALLGAGFAPNRLSRFGAPDWGVGAQHDNQAAANVSYADGSVRSVQIETIRARTSGPDQFTWFENQ